jgi:hypothetical protein
MQIIQLEPPLSEDHDYNPEIDQMIEDRLFESERIEREELG